MKQKAGDSTTGNLMREWDSPSHCTPSYCQPEPQANVYSLPKLTKH